MPIQYEDLYGAHNDYGHAGGGSPYDSESLLNNPLINNFATRGLLSGVQWIGETLGKPQAALFGALKGDFAQLANLIPFSDTLGITNTGDPNKGLTTERVGGRDLLRHYGAVDQENNWGNFAGGLALDILADPLAWVRGPLGALTKEGAKLAKTTGTARTVAGRIKEGSGGLFSITDRPWYADLVADWVPGIKKAENVYVAGVDPFLKKPFEKVAQGMDVGWNKLTEMPYSPLAWARSAFEPGAANYSGHPKAVRVFGETNRPEYERLVTEHAGRIGASDIYGKQADYINKLKATGLDDSKTDYLMQQAAYSIKEHGVEKYMPSWASDEQLAIAKDWGKEYTALSGNLTDAPRQAALDVGHVVGDVEQRLWKFPYVPRAQAGAGNKLTTHSTARNPAIEKLPGGSAQANQMLSDPVWAGVSHVSDKADDAIAEGVKKYAPQIQQDAIDRISKVYAATAEKVPEELQKLKTFEGAAELAAEIGAIASKRKMPDSFHQEIAKIKLMNDEIAARGGDLIPLEPMGSYYRGDLATEHLDYGKGMAKLTAPKHSAIETLMRYAEDAKKPAVGKAIIPLDEALNEIKIPTAKAELARRMGVNEADLSKQGVRHDLVEALRKEVNPPPATEKSVFTKAMDALRYGLTVPWPANYVRNLTSTVADMGTAETGAFKNIVNASDIQRGALTDPKTYAKMQPILQKAVEHGVIGTDQIHALLGTGFDSAGNFAVNVKTPQVDKSAIQSLKDWGKSVVSKDAGREQGVIPLGELAADTAMNPTMKKAAGVLGYAVDPFRRWMVAMERAQRFQDQVTRLQQFANLTEQGYSAGAAAKRVKVNQRDYLDGSTPFVNEKLSSLIPFARFSVQNLKAQADMLSRNTGRYSALMSLLNSGRDSGGFVPGYASSGAAIPLGSPSDGKQAYLGSLGLTQEDEALSALASFAGLRGREGIRKLASSSNPLLKVPFELATGTQVFSGRKLDDLEPSAIASLMTLGQSPDLARTLSSVAYGTPAARVFSTVDRLANMESKGPIATLLNLSTGLRSTTVDTQAAAQIAARDTIAKLLNASEQYKTREQLVVDPKWAGRQEEMPPEIQELFRQYELLQQAGKAAVKERQASGR